MAGGNGAWPLRPSTGRLPAIHRNGARPAIPTRLPAPTASGSSRTRCASTRINLSTQPAAPTYQLVHRLPAPTMPSHIGFSPDSLTPVYITHTGNQQPDRDRSRDRRAAMDRSGGPAAGWGAGAPGRHDLGGDHGFRPYRRNRSRATAGSSASSVTGAGAAPAPLRPDGQDWLYVFHPIAWPARSPGARRGHARPLPAALAAPGGPDDMAVERRRQAAVGDRPLAGLGRCHRAGKSGALRTTIPAEAGRRTGSC